MSEKLINIPRPYIQGKKIESLIHFIPFGICIVDKNRRIVSRNLAFNYLFEIIEYEDDSAVEIKDCQGLMSSGFFYFVNDCFDTKDVIESEMYFTNDSEQIFTKLTIFPALDRMGEVEYLTASIEDITKQKKAEEKYLNINEMLRLHKNNSPLAYIEFNTEFEVIEWNNSAERIFGFSSAEILGKTINSMLFDNYDANFGIEFVKSFDNKDNSGRKYKNTIKSKRYITCEWYNTTLITHNGQKVGYGSLILDITKQISAEKALVENEKMFRQIVENQSDAIVRVDADDKFIVVNPAMEEIFECSQNEIIGKTLSTFLDSENIKLLEDQNLIRQKGEKSTYELKINSAKNNTKWIAISATPECDINGGYLGAFAVIRDITDRRQAELKIQENQERFNTIFTHSNDIINILDENCSITYYSPNIIKIIGRGYTPEELHNPFISIHPKELPDVKTAFNQMLNDPDKIGALQYRFKKTDNTYMWVESIAINLFDNPTIKGILLSSRDITDRRQAEDALKMSERNLRTVVNNANVLIFILDKAGEILLSEGKALELFKFKPGQIVGLSIFDIFEEDQKAVADIELAFQGYEIQSKFEIQSFIFETVYSPYYDEYGNIAGIVAIALDVSERIKADQERETLIEELQFSRETVIEEANKLIVLNDKLLESEAQLQKSNAEKDKFFSIMSHDLRSPLSGLMGLAETLVVYHDKYSEQEIFSSIQLIFDTSKHTYKLLDNLLLWSRMNRNVLDFSPDDFNLKDLVTSVSDLLLNNAIQKNIKLINSVAPEIHVFADGNMASTIIRNLISNAIKFTNSGDKIEVTSEQIADNVVKVNIADTGIGMTEEVMNKLFRLDSHHTSLGTANEKGTGLGLILCKEMVEKNGGEISVSSVNGNGTTFSFTLPIAHINPNLIIDDDSESEINNQDSDNCEIIDDDLSPELISILPLLIKDLENDFLSRKERVQSTLIISDIILFAENLKEFSESYGINMINEYATKLYEKCKMMDIKNIDDMLTNFTDLIEKLKKII